MPILNFTHRFSNILGGQEIYAISDTTVGEMVKQVSFSEIGLLYLVLVMLKHLPDHIL
jgi:hypothetical protein